MTPEEKERLIIRDIKEETGINPIKIFKTIAHKDYISMHGPGAVTSIGAAPAIKNRIVINRR